MKIYFYDIKWYTGKKGQYNCSLTAYIDSTAYSKSVYDVAERAVKALPFVTNIHSIGFSYTWEQGKKALVRVLCTVSSFPARCTFYRPSLSDDNWEKELIGKGYIVVDLDSLKVYHVKLLSEVSDLQKMPRY